MIHGHEEGRQMESNPPITPADAFELVGNEIRVGIIQVLQDAYRDGDRSLPYVTLQSRVGVRDSGQFNYHLQQLVGQFVRKDGSDYRLTYAGQTVASAIVSGAYNSRTTLVLSRLRDPVTDVERNVSN